MGPTTFPPSGMHPSTPPTARYEDIFTLGRETRLEREAQRMRVQGKRSPMREW